MYLFMPCNVYAEFAHVQYQIHIFFLLAHSGSPGTLDSLDTMKPFDNLKNVKQTRSEISREF